MTLMDKANISDEKLANRCELLDALAEQAEKMNGKLLDLELEIEVARRERNDATQERLIQQYNAMVADAKRMQFRFERLSTQFLNWQVLASIDATRSITKSGILSVSEARELAGWRGQQVDLPQPVGQVTSVNGLTPDELTEAETWNQ